MVAKRIIPCLDIKGGRTVKGVNFLNLRDMGDPVELAERYCREGADELVFLDISATNEERGTTLDVVRSVARVVTIPFTVGGGISSVRDVSRLLEAGADKVSINSAAIWNPDLIEGLAKEFGTQCLVVAIDSKQTDDCDRVFVNAGKIATSRLTQEWSREVCDRGAGEILLTSMDCDGMRDGFACELIGTISRELPIPVIASGGAGSQCHFLDVLQGADADAALASGIFHERVLTISSVKQFLVENGVEVRL
jgi:cyclase